MHSYVLETYEREKLLLKKAKELNQDFLSEKIKLEKMSIRNVENSQMCQNMDKEKEKAQKELNECEEANDILQYKLAEMRVYN